MLRPVKLVFSCEHAGNRIPRMFRSLTFGHEELLQTHKAYDLGINAVFKRFKRRYACRAVSTQLSRLLIDQNRSPHSSQLFSEISLNASAPQKAWLLRHHKRYISSLEHSIHYGLRYGPVLHLSFHSFTPVFEGSKREVDFGILFDAENKPEEEAASRLYAECAKIAGLTVRINEPYLGTDDGMCTLFRSRYKDRGYMGIELEFKQSGISPGLSREFQTVINVLDSWIKETEKIYDRNS